ncbi:hypothetical protein [Candidatus Albibeggiatoa sp. nov. NOAA]|uniref:hypothetical protein n=1 Tax=Candidatus Albibeggiatoa sp. nov. NOAA TaxID=3162724 RepID=UPI0032FA0271|nr:hypothetical protein [Thiotrichaceae bacterium]
MSPLKLFSLIPLFAVLLIIYLVMMMSGVDFSAAAEPLFSATLLSGAEWAPTISDILIILGVVLLYIEIFKSTRTGTTSIIEHGISMATFLAFLIIFLTIKDAGTPTFLILTLMSLLDVVGGFTVTISAARRDWGGGHAH